MYVQLDSNGKVLATADKLSNEQRADRSWTDRWDWKTFDQVTSMAQDLSLMKNTMFLPVDKGEHCSPRFDVMEVPKVGDEVSKGFNGDYYPCGTIKEVKMRYGALTVTTTTDHVFRRYKQTANFLDKAKTFSMVSGHHDERNPSF